MVMSWVLDRGPIYANLDGFVQLTSFSLEELPPPTMLQEQSI